MSYITRIEVSDLVQGDDGMLHPPTETTALSPDSITAGALDWFSRWRRERRHHHHHHDPEPYRPPVGPTGHGGGYYTQAPGGIT